jgi:secretion/DNA translocation related CpaE-like protein
MTDAISPLIVTADEQLLDDALRWCAAAGAVPEVAHDVTAARRAWRGAAAVVVGEDLAPPLVRAGLVRREHVLLLAREPAQWWPVGIDLGVAAVCTPHEEDRALEVLAAALDGAGEAVVVCVVGGSGGVGASTFAVSLALAAHRRGLRPLVFDADDLGGGVELVLGAERSDGLRWDDFGATRGRLSAGALTDVLPVHRGVASLSWRTAARGPLPESVPAVLGAALRGFDLVVADVPRHLGRHGPEIVGRSVLTVVLVPEEVCGVAAARRVVDALRRLAPSVAAVTVARPGGTGPGPVAEAVGVPVLARLRPDRRARAGVDRGQGPGRSRSSRRAASSVLDALGLGPT